MIYKKVKFEQSIMNFLNIFMILILLGGVIDLFISNILDLSILSFWPEIIFTIFMGFFLINLIAKKSISKKNWFLISFIIIYITIQLLVSMIKIPLIQFIFGCKVVLFYIPIYFIFYFIDEVDINYYIKKITKIICILSIIMFFIGLIQYFIGYETLLKIYGDSVKGYTTKGILRVFSSTKSPFEYAWYCLISFSICFSYILFENRRNKLINLSLIISLVGIILSNSREGILNLLVVMVTILVIKHITRRKINVKLIKIYLYIIPFLGIFVFGIINKISTMDIMTNNVYLDSILSGASFNERFEVWEKALNMYDMNNLLSLLFGNGVGSVGAAQGLMNKIGYSIVQNPVDNLYLYLYLNIGLIGSIALLVFVYSNLNIIINNLYNVKFKYFQVAVLAIISSIFIGGYFRTVIEGIVVQVVLIYLLGIAYKASINKDNRN